MAQVVRTRYRVVGGVWVIEGATIFFVAVLGDLLGEGDVNLWGGRWTGGAQFRLVGGVGLLIGFKGVEWKRLAESEMGGG